MGNMSKRVVLITGGSSGIGFEMAKQMAAQKSRVIICGRSQNRLDIAREKVPELEAIQCDITRKEDRIGLFEKIKKDHSNLNMLMNNAGIVNRFLFAKAEHLEEKLTQEWQVNYLAPIMLVKQLLPVLTQTRGTIVNVTSGLVYVPLSIQPNYCATKAALHSMTQSMRLQLSGLGIKVQEIFYPAVDTPFQGGQAPDFAIKADKAAAIALKGLNKGKNEIHVKMAGILSWLSRLMPQKSTTIINRAVPGNIEALLSKEES